MVDFVWYRPTLVFRRLLVQPVDDTEDILSLVATDDDKELTDEVSETILVRITLGLLLLVVVVVVVVVWLFFFVVVVRFATDACWRDGTVIGAVEVWTTEDLRGITRKAEDAEEEELEEDDLTEEEEDESDDWILSLKFLEEGIKEREVKDREEEDTDDDEDDTVEVLDDVEIEEDDDDDDDEEESCELTEDDRFRFFFTRCLVVGGVLDLFVASSVPLTTDRFPRWEFDVVLSIFWLLLCERFSLSE